MNDQTLWNRVIDLDGQTLRTLHRDKEFDIVGVSMESVRVIPKGAKRRQPRTVHREDVIRIAQMGLNREQLRSRTADVLPRRGVTSYIATIVYEVTRLQ